MRLILVRHGQSEGNASRIFQGRTDYGLTALGHEQARRTGELIQRTVGAEVTGVLTSPLRRAAETASSIAGALGLEATTEDALLEYDVGAISGLTLPEVQDRFPEIIKAWQSGAGERALLPGEEGRQPFFERVRNFIDGLDWRSPGALVAVTHGGVVNAVCYIALGLEFPDFFRRRVSFAVRNCSITEFRGDQRGHIILVRHNDSCHLASAS